MIGVLEKIFCLLIITVFCIHDVNAQQRPFITQGINNPILTNPAFLSRPTYSPSWVFQATSQVRLAGIPGGPKTLSISAMKFNSDSSKWAIGLSATRDEIGLSRQFEFEGAGSYRLPLGDGERQPSLSFGMRIVFRSVQMSHDEAILNGIQDPNFENRILSGLGLNFGGGILYSTTTFFAGVSIPYFDIDDLAFNNSDFSLLRSRSVLLSMGNTFREESEIQPKLFGSINFPFQGNFQWELNAGLFFNNYIFLGVGYRQFSESLMFTGELQLSSHLRFSYTADMISGLPSEIGGGMHNLSIEYSLKKRKRENFLNYY